MINKKIYTKNYLEKQLIKYPKLDPTKIETTVFAFGLLEALVRNGLPLIFKGGTSLLLLLDNPERISTDIDIIVPKEIDFDKTFCKIKKQFPFYEGEERGIAKSNYFRHFYFSFDGPLSNKKCRINLDVAFEDNPYTKIIEREIKLPFIETVGKRYYVSVPSYESIMGDKLTAFAPTTIGVNPFFTSLGKPIDNRLQVMKQFYDIARIFDYISNIKEVMESYRKCHLYEINFRNVSYSTKDTLLDTYKHAAIIASSGSWDKSNTFYTNVYKPGLQGLKTNIFSGKYNHIDASNDAAKIMFLVSCLLCGEDLVIKKYSYKGNRLKDFKAIINNECFEYIRYSLYLMESNHLL